MGKDFSNILNVRADEETGILFLRIGLAGAGALLLFLTSAIVSQAPMTRAPVDVFLLIIAGAMGLGILALAGLARPSEKLRWLVLVAALSELLVRSVILAQTPSSADLTTVDQGYYTDFAGQLLMRGQNPYAWDLSGTFDLYRGDRATSTPRLNGASEQVYPYPALPFVLVAPLESSGLPGVFLVSILAEAALLVLLFVGSPPLIQPLILLPIVVGTDFAGLALLGTLDAVWILLLVGMVMAWRRPRLAGLLFGLAAAAKQSPWILAPFLLIRIWREPQNGKRLKHLAEFVGFSMLAFAVTNLPFILWNPAAWLTGATEPLRDDMVFFSQGGLASLTQLGWLALPKAFYLLATLAVLAVLLFAFWRHYGTLREAVWVMPGIVMWFSYRNLITYWAPWGLLLLAAIVTTRRQSIPDSAPSTAPRKDREAPLRMRGGSGSKRGSWAPTIGLTGAAAGALVFAGIVLGGGPAQVVVTPNYPLLTTDGQVTHVTLQIENHSLRTLAPRFALQQTSASFNPLPWQTDQGPATVESGQSATFQISPENPADSFFVHEKAQIIVTDANGDYGLRGVTSIGPDPSFLWPDAIPNPAFLFWDESNKTPIFWSYEPGTASGDVTLVQKDSRIALALGVNGQSAGTKRVGLENWVIYPQKPFGLWVYGEPEPAGAYGMELDDGTHQLQIQFDQGNGVELTNGTLVIHRAVPQAAWSYQTIDLPGIYAQAGWSLPALMPSDYRNIAADLPLVMIHLYLTRDGGTGKAQAFFGPIVQDYGVDSQALMASTLEDPVGYYLTLGDSYLQERIYPRAIDAYRRALAYAPGNEKAIEGMKSAQSALSQ